MSPGRELKATLQQLEEIHPTRLSIAKLRELQQSIADQLSQLTERASECAQAASEALRQADPKVLRFAKDEAVKLRAQAEELEDLDAKLESNIQRQLMRDNMLRRIGSNRRLVALEGLIVALIVLVLGLLMYDLTAGPDTARPGWLSKGNIFLIDLGCCAIFMAEFVFRFSCADSKRYLWKHHWIDFVTSIPIPGEAQLARFGRVARLARFARFIRVLRLLRVFFILWRGMDKLQDVIDVKMMKKTVRWAVVATLLGAIAMYKLEGSQVAGPSGVESPNPVGNMLLATWWSFTTVLTGGFGDIHNPESIAGQVLTAVLVITGMVFVGVFTATLTSLFVGEQSEEVGRLQEELSQKLDQIGKRLEQLERP